MKALLIYGSTTGMTEMVALEIKEVLENAGIELEFFNVLDASTTYFDEHENILLGVSTWDYGCLQYDFEIFFDQIENYDFTGKKVTVFGTGDRAYGDTYCEAVRTVSKTCRENGAEPLYQDLEIECDLTEERLEEARKWAEGVVGAIIGDK